MVDGDPHAKLQDLVPLDGFLILNLNPKKAHPALQL